MMRVSVLIKVPVKGGSTSLELMIVVIDGKNVVDGGRSIGVL